MDTPTMAGREVRRRRTRRTVAVDPAVAGVSGRSRRAERARPAQVQAVLAGAERAGLLAASDSRIAGRVSATLIERAKARTGLRSDTELLVFALANVALEDEFAEAFRKLAGTVDPSLDLEF
jgi:hypothetical protein